MTLSHDDLIRCLDDLSGPQLAALSGEWQRKFALSPSQIEGPGPRTVVDPLPPAVATVDVTIVDVGPQKIQVIKLLREVRSLGLAEAKQMADSAPIALGAGLEKAEADALAKRFSDVGAVVKVA